MSSLSLNVLFCVCVHAEMATSFARTRNLAIMMATSFLIVTMFNAPELISDPLQLTISQDLVSTCDSNPFTHEYPIRTALQSMNTVKSLCIFIDRFDDLNVFYGNAFTRAEKDIPQSCPLPDGGTCIVHHSIAHSKSSNVVLRMARFASRWKNVRYHDNQLLAIFQSEAGRGEYGLQQLRDADIKISFHPSSDILSTEVCNLPVHTWETKPPPSPSERRGVALFVSNCKLFSNSRWRSNYLVELMKHIHIDSYGKCWHNVETPVTRSNAFDSFSGLASKYRMVVAFENTIEDDYISEKLNLVYSSGAIPVYWGPPQIYSWVPGNHTFIDASKFQGPKDLAEYLKRVDMEDDLFRYHTSNFDIAKTKERIASLCPNRSMLCSLCHVAHKKLRLRRLKELHELY